jgi:hypothetical protein
MQSRDIELIAMVIVFIIAAVGIAVFIIIPWGSQGGEISNSEFGINLTNYSNNKLPQTSTECLATYSIESSRVVFIYSDTCVYSNQMKPWVQQLEGQGYKFLWVNIKNSSAIQIVSTCLSNVLRFEGTPEFICPSNEKSVVGIFTSIGEMENFANACK